MNNPLKEQSYFLLGMQTDIWKTVFRRSNIIRVKFTQIKLA